MAQSASTGTITGRVLNVATGEYLRNAVVKVAGTDVSTLSEAGGYYRLLNVPAGTVNLEVTYTGLERATASATVGAGQTAVVDVQLAGDSSTVVLETYTVRAEVEGNAKALQEQRQALEIKSVVASDAFGDVSEGNVAEFLKMMPGLTIDFVEADARAVSLGGLDPKYTTVTMDGAPVASAGSSFIGTGRTFEFEQLSVSSIEAIEVSKTPTPDVAGSALAGVINLRSKGAFDRKGRQISWQTSVAANGRNLDFKKTQGPDDGSSYKMRPSFSLQYSDVFNDRLGVLAGVNYSWSFAPQKFFVPVHQYDANPANNATEIPRIATLTHMNQQKPTERTNYNLRLDYKFSPDISVWGRVDYNTYEARVYGRDFVIGFPTATATTNTIVNSPRGETATGAPLWAAGPVEAGVEFSRNSQTSTAGTTSFQGSSAAFVKHGETTTFSSGASYRRGAFRANIQGAYSKATNFYDDTNYGMFWTFGTATAAAQRLTVTRSSHEDPAITLTAPNENWKSIANYPGNASGTRNERNSKNQKWNGKADFRYDFAGWKFPVQLKWGAAVDLNVQDLNRPRVGQTWTYLGPDLLTSTSPGGTVANNADNLLSLRPEPIYRMTFPWGGNVQNLVNFDRFSLAREFAANPERFTAPFPATVLLQPLQQAKDIKEQVDALYVQPIIKVTSKFTIAPGFRWERTRGSARGLTDIGNPAAWRALGQPETTAQPAINATTPLDYIIARYGTPEPLPIRDTTSLKYLHLAYRLTENVTLRASYNDSITRPPYAQLAGGLQITNEELQRANISNASLRPEHGRNMFLGADYAFSKGDGYISLSFARRDMIDLIRSKTIAVPIDGDFLGDPFWAGWDISTAENVAKAHVGSGEFSYRQRLKRHLTFLPESFRDLTIFGSYSRYLYDNVNNFFRVDPIPGLTVGAPIGHQASGGATYNYRNLGVTWTTTWKPRARAESVQANGWSKFLGEFQSHDIQLNYRLPWKGVTLFLTGRNIFKEPTKHFRGGGGAEDILLRYSDTGSFWTLGAKGTF